MALDPNRLVVLMKFMKYKYADAFINSGTMKFGNAEIWSKANVTEGTGRGDKLEGIYAVCNSSDYIERHTYLQRYDDSYAEQYKRLVYFRSKKIMELPCYCLYGVAVHDFMQEDEIHEQPYLHVTPKFFHEFTDIPTDSYAKVRNDENRPSLILILDPYEFNKRVVNALHSLGVNADKIIMDGVRYFGKLRTMDISPSPLELLWKSLEYKHQNEVRIIVNSDNTDVVRLLNTETIKIGPLNDIAIHFDSHFENGLTLKLFIDEIQKKYSVGLSSR